MKTTEKALVGWIAVAIVLSANIAAANPLGSAPLTWIGTAILGQSSSTDDSSQNAEQQTADLLKRARQAMAEKNFSAAESLISQAEALGVQYNLLHMGDTPKKARRDLERARNSTTGTLPNPSQLLDPLGINKNKQAPESDPFAGRSIEPPPSLADSKQIMPLPKVDSSRPALLTPPQGALGAPSANDSPLRAARLALAVGDIRRAAELTQQAKSMPVRYQPLDDTPEKVEAAIRAHQEMAALDKNSESYQRANARNLMEQADALLRWGAFDEAERLAGRAAGIRIIYGPFEQKPQELLQRIDAARKQALARNTAPQASEPGYATASATPSVSLATRQQTVELVRQAREAIAAGQFDRAEMLARQAEMLRLPESAFAPGEDRPSLVLLDLRQLKMREGAAAVPAAFNGDPNQPAASHAVYDPNNDPTRNMAASSQQPMQRGDPRLAQNAGQTPLTPPAPPTDMDAAGPKAPGMMLFEQGEAALKARDTKRAYDLFRQAATRINELDPVTAQRLQDHLQLLSAPTRAGAAPSQATQAPTMADEALARQQVLARSVAAELAHKESNARAMRDADPKGALALLEEARKKVETSGLESTIRDQLLRRADRAIAETQRYIEENRPHIELAEKNERTRQDVEREQRVKLEIDEKLALMTDEFNRLMDEQRYEEGQVVASRAAELAPDNPVTAQMLWQAKFVRRMMNNQALADSKEQGFIDTLESVDVASIPFDDRKPMVFPDAQEWSKLSANRKKYLAERGRQRSERDIEIEKKLRTPVSLQFTNAPLSKVLENLAKLAEVNLHLDPQGLAEEGVTTDTPVTIELRNDIMLKSALNLILEPLHLSYVIKDEVLKITSEQMRDGQIYAVTYNVADLVVPIPNFVPTDMGLQSAYNSAMAHVGLGGGAPFGAAQATPLAVVASKSGKNSSASINPNMLAQVSSGVPGMPGMGSPNVPIGQGPGGLGGGAQPDFDSLIELITTTVRPTTWDEVGGPGSIAPFETNLSLVISQTQEVHEEIEDLLQQLRRLQDLQVTIEVRYITLNDNFFERIGVSFDFAVNDNIDSVNPPYPTFQRQTAGPTYVSPAQFATNAGVPRSVLNADTDRTVTVGMSAPGLFNADLDVPFTQNSYGLAIPQFGGFDATAGASLGFAILSDIEAYFFLNAAQGDKRTNVLQAPKVTLFNGQQAYVSDTSQSPFVISVIPVVGDFAAAQQPVIVVLSEGTFMTVQAVISNDRRFVRLTVVPFFSEIGDVQTFQFTGETTTTVDTTREGLQSAATDPEKLWNKKGDQATTTTSGTTVQLPTFSFVTVTTTVSVPDGGTVLLGGIKRLSEGRNEFGVPMLNKLPYINRLFKNVGIGRETQSLMMMVTPRIIIQEEEEENIGVPSTP